ncbi:MAG: LarC family nickel insertion protein [Acidobacteria bacterium]|nr:LarC family nickel insertion protein [Acidobacteriota bacterium]
MTERILYIDSVGGLAGDMFLGAAVDAGFVTLDELQSIVSRWLPERVLLHSEVVLRNDMRARTFHVEVVHSHDHEHHDHHGHSHENGHEHGHEQGHEDRNLEAVSALLANAPIPDGARARALRMFHELAEAEARVHGASPSTVHFHEVGATDSLVDFALAGYVLDKLSVRIEASPLRAGRGFVRMRHGTWPVPAPGTAEILREGEIPLRGLPEDFPWENAELTTPTGACIARRADSFGDLPEGTPIAIGLGAGYRDIPGYPNVTRLVLVERPPAQQARPPAQHTHAAPSAPADAAPSAPADAVQAAAPARDSLSTTRFDTDVVALLETFIDDLPGNLLAEACEAALEAGALEVATSTVTLRKGRVGYRVELIAPLEKAEAVAAVVLGRTTAIGLRIRETTRWKLWRTEAVTPDGLVAKLSRDSEGRIARLVPETYAAVERARAEGRAPMALFRIDDRSSK